MKLYLQSTTHTERKAAKAVTTVAARDAGAESRQISIVRVRIIKCQEIRNEIIKVFIL